MARSFALLASLALVLFGLWLFFGQVGAQPAAQTDPTAAWDEGRPVTAEVAQDDVAISAVPTTPGTYYRTFSGTRFQPTSSTLTYLAAGGAIYATALPPGNFSFSLDFDLPPGAAITEVVFFVIDSDATNMDLSLRSYNPETDAFTALKSATTTGASPTLQTIVIPVDPPVQVANATTSYRLRVAPGVASSAHLLRGARIGYTVPQALLPVISK